MPIPGLIHNLLKNFTAGAFALAFAGGITVNSPAEESPIQFVALVNMNDPASIVATGALTGSNLDLTISVPPDTTGVKIIGTSDGFTPAGPTLWQIVALPPLPPRHTNNLPPPIPPTRPPPIIITNVPPLILVTNPVIIPPLIPPVIIVTSPPPPVVIVNDLNSGSEFAGSAGLSLQVSSLQVIIRDPGLPLPHLPPLPPIVIGSLPGIVTAHLELSEADITRFLDGLCLLVFVDQSNAVSQVAHILQLDSDFDGVPDSRDLCPDTPPDSIVNSHGCSIDQLVPCDAPWKNHGHFVQEFNRVLSSFQQAGLIDATLARDLRRAAAQSGCGQPNRH